MRARDVARYSRPETLTEALSRVAHGAIPLAGGTRLLAEERELPEVVDLGGLGPSRIAERDNDLVVNASATLQDVIDEPLAWQATRGLLPQACRAHSASRMLRSQATLAGEAIHAAHDSEVAAALLALNAIFVVSRSDAETEIPALRFIGHSADDLGGAALVTSIVIPGWPGGTALERLAVLPSAPALLVVAASVSFAGDTCIRARVAIGGLDSVPARVPEAEKRLEGTGGGAEALAAFVDEALARASFRDDAHASADYRRRVAAPLLRRALVRAMADARAPHDPVLPRLWPRRPLPAPTAVPLFEHDDLVVRVNDKLRRGPASAGTTLLAWLRDRGVWGVKHGCETGECGACAVLLDGRPAVSCMTLAVQALARQVTTVEGLGSPEALHPVQRAFVDSGAVQCGFCTPAMVVCGAALLKAVRDPDEAQARDALAGCLCRCTGYVKPVAALLDAAGAKR